MIRVEFFLSLAEKAMGVEMQFFRLNAQINLGWRFLFKLEQKTAAKLLLIGPLGLVGWIDPEEIIRA